MARMLPDDVRQLRSNVVRNVQRAPIVGGFVAVVLDIVVFYPMRLLAQWGLRRRRGAMPRRDGDGGFGTAGVGAKLPVIPPSKAVPLGAISRAANPPISPRRTALL